MDNINLKISIITVCYNSENYIEKTILSALKQSYNNLEYIIIDGKSTDKTMNIVKKYSIQDKRIKYVSENDKGIYDAMNKGIELSTGDFIFFLNSGDLFVDEHVVSNFVNIAKRIKADIYYGNIYDVFNNYSEKSKYNDLRITKYEFLIGKSICHQAIFASTKVLKLTKFDVQFLICADKEWLIRCHKLKYKFSYVDIDICNFDKTGISSQAENSKKIYSETKKILYNHYPYSARIRYIIKRIRLIRNLIYKMMER